MHRICLLTLTFARHAVLTVTLDLYINSDLIQTRVIGRPNLRLTKLSAEIYFGDLHKLQKTQFLNVFKTFSPRSGLWIKVTYVNWKL